MREKGYDLRLVEDKYIYEIVIFCTLSLWASKGNGKVLGVTRKYRITEDGLRQSDSNILFRGLQH